MCQRLSHTSFSHSAAQVSLFFFLCQVSHHPPISAFYICNRKDGFSISGSILAKSKFYGTIHSTLQYVILCHSRKISNRDYTYICYIWSNVNARKDKSPPFPRGKTNCCRNELFKGSLQGKKILVFFNQGIFCPSAVVGNSLSAILDGKARLLFLSRDEEYVITMPYAHCKGNRSWWLSLLINLPMPLMPCLHWQ